MINLTKILNFKIILVILIVGISLVVWANFRKTRKTLKDNILQNQNTYVMVKKKSSQIIFNLSNNLEQNLFQNFLERDSEVFLPFNGQIILEK